MNALALIRTLRQQGVKLAIVDDRLRVIQPRSRPLSGAEKAEVRRHTGEILQRLKAGGIIAEDIAAVFPGSVDITAAVIWLRERLTSPQHIAVLVAEWVGPLERPTGKDVDDLMAARWVLGVVAFVGADGRCWWRLPVKTVH
jgi:hypothetical protein